MNGNERERTGMHGKGVTRMVHDIMEHSIKLYSQLYQEGGARHNVPSKLLSMGDFDKWRNTKHRFSDLPPNVQGHIREQLKVPAGLNTPIPNDRLSVLDFMAANIPTVCQQTSSYIIPSGFSFFSAEKSSESFLRQMAVIMVPSKTIVADLMASATQKWLDGANSITIPGNPLFYPLWMLQVWVELHLTVVPTRNSWQKSINWLQHKELALFQEKVNSVYHSLSTLSWSSAREGLLSALPGKTTFPKSTLAKYLSRDWLTDEHVDQMIYLVEREVKEILPHQKIHFLDTVLIRKLRQAYQLEIDAKEKYNPFDTTFLHKFGQSLSSDSQLASIFHINGNHWIAVVINILTEEILYGDSVGSDPNLGVVNSIRWFISKHIPSLPEDSLNDAILPCVKQDVKFDWFNCGIYSYNALLHYFLPNNPLLQHTENPIYGDLARMSILQKLIEFHNAVSSNF